MEGRQGGYRSALASPALRALVLSQLVSVGGSSLAAVALTVLVYRRTSSPLLASLSFAVAFAPYLVGGAVLSSLVDRVRPRRLVVCCDAASAVAAAAMAVPALPVGALLGLLFAIGCSSSAASGSRAALVRAAATEEAYVPARSLMRIAAQVAQLGGNAVAGALLVVTSPGTVFVVNAASFALSSATIRLRVGDHPLGDRTDKVMGSLRGARVVMAGRALRRLLLLGWVVPMLGVAPEAVAAAYVADHHEPASLVGWWLTALPIGLIAGDFAGVRLLRPATQRRLVSPAAAAGFVPLVVFFADPPVPVAIALLVVSGAAGLWALGLDALVRDTAPPHLFARTMALGTAGLMALQGLGFALAGAVAQVAGPGVAVGAAGVCGLASVAALRVGGP